MATPDKATQSLALSPFATQQSFEAVQRVCQLLASSELVPKIYHASNGHKAIANCLLAFEMANRIGTSPLMVMQNMYIVNGQPAWSSKFLIATINSCGRFSSLRYEFCGKDGEDNFGCRCYAFDKSDVDREHPLYGAWVDIFMAKKEGWYTKAGSKWPTMPQLMLQYRAATFWARTYAPELSMGIRTDDEAADIVDVAYEEMPSSASKAAELNKALTSAAKPTEHEGCNSTTTVGNAT